MDRKELITKLTLEEKLRLLTGEDNWGTVPIDRLGIPKVVVSDGPHGLRKLRAGELTLEQSAQVPAMAYPTYASVAATWNTDLAKRMGAAIAEECVANDVDVLLGPGTNMKRHPLCGRNFEYFSEDPYLAGQFAAAFIEGVQSRGVGTSLKHFAANNQEDDRLWVSSEIDERTLREIYLPAFEEAVKKSVPWTVMCSYNRLNGTHASQNAYLLDEILRKEWEFEGTVISDWFAVHDRAAALKATLDLQMPYDAEAYPNLEKAFADHRITMEEINRGVDSVLRLVEKVMEAMPMKSEVRKELEKSPDAMARYMALGREIAEESITLLKNEGDILPLSVDNCKKIAVIGGFAVHPVIGGGGSSNVTPACLETPLEEIRKLAGGNCDVVYNAAYHPWSNHGALTERLNVGQALADAYGADVVLLFAANTTEIEMEGADRPRMTLTKEQEDTILEAAAVNPNVIVILQTGSAVDMSRWIDKVKGVVWQGYAGAAGAGALAEILFGKVNPSGKLSESYPYRLEDTPVYEGASGDREEINLQYPGNGKAVWYREGLFIGYRYYDTFGKDVRFPFGYGLSYTSFAYSDLSVNVEDGTEPQVRVTFSVTNTGTREGKEAAQIYVRDVVSAVLRPEKELKAFKKLNLAPGETKQVSVLLDRRAFAYYNVNLRDWQVKPGMFEIQVGASSRDIRLKEAVKL